jgi:hypothetical protein
VNIYASDFCDTPKYYASIVSMQIIFCVGIFHESNYFVGENIMRVTLVILPNIMLAIISMQNIFCVGIFYASDFIDTTEYFASNNFVDEIFMRVFLGTLPNIMRALLVCKLYFVLGYFMRAIILLMEIFCEYFWNHSLIFCE